MSHQAKVSDVRDQEDGSTGEEFATQAEDHSSNPRTQWKAGLGVTEVGPLNQAGQLDQPKQ